jgi:hypothetical protein
MIERPDCELVGSQPSQGIGHLERAPLRFTTPLRADMRFDLTEFNGSSSSTVMESSTDSMWRPSD